MTPLTVSLKPNLNMLSMVERHPQAQLSSRGAIQAVRASGSNFRAVRLDCPNVMDIQRQAI